MDQTIYNKILQRLLRESRDLGEIEFSPIRVDGVDTTEEDTFDEKVIFKGLQSWIGSPVVGKKYLKDIRDVARNPKYAEFFNAPAGQVIYRGVSFDVEKLKRWLGLGEDDFLEPKGEKSVNLVRGPGDNLGASWTYDYDVAKFFAKIFSDGMEDLYGEEGQAGPIIVLTAVTDGIPGNYIDISSMSKKMKPGSFLTFQDRDEHEVLQLGPVRITKIEWDTGEASEEV